MTGVFKAWRWVSAQDAASVLAAPVAFLIAVACVPSWAGMATSPRWVLVALSVYFIDWWCLPFTILCLWKLDFDQAAHWTFLCGALCWGMRLDDRTLERVITWFAAGVAVSSVLAIGQTFWDWAVVPQLISPAGLFLNKNLLAEAACFVVIAALIRGQWWSVAVAMPALVLTWERAAWLGAFMSCFVLVPMKQRVWLVVAGGALIATFLWTGFDLGTSTMAQRVLIWRDAVNSLTWLGNGSYDLSGVTIREPNLHNDWLQFVFELGVAGLAVNCVFAWWAVRSYQSMVFMVAIIVVGSFSFPLHMPATGWFIAIVIGNSLRRGHVAGRVSLPPRLEDPQLRRSGGSPSAVSLS
jgi:hypothetical protein